MCDIDISILITILISTHHYSKHGSKYWHVTIILFWHMTRIVYTKNSQVLSCEFVVCQVHDSLYVYYLLNTLCLCNGFAMERSFKNYLVR